jgi:hypothetical protein
MFTPNPFSTRPISAARTFTFTASLPVSAMPARTRFNERGEMHVDSAPRRRRDRFNFSIVGSLVGDGAGVTSTHMIEMFHFH